MRWTGWSRPTKNRAMEKVHSRVQLLVLERREPAINMKRFYVLSVEPTLFERDYALVREWGRLGTSCRRRLDLFPSETQARCSLGTWLARKKAKGYKVVLDEAPPEHA